MDILNTAPQAPRMNAQCERVLRTLRHELCDHVLVLNAARARRLLSTFEHHYNHHRPHQARNQLLPNTDQQPTTIHDLTAHRLHHTPVLGGVNEYRYAA